ncbi:MAG TPA: Tim44-like domain-containing protein [Burkholderiales bacterium]|nr:Tim44-like domain-containing protein [Burkholderiales bacterium]
MKQLLIGLCAVLIGAVVFAGDAEAKRLGGGRSMGAQRSVTPPASAPSRSQTPQTAPAPQQQPQPGGIGRWLGPILGGLALGGLLGWLVGGNGLGGVLLLALLVFAAVMAVRAFARRGQAQSEPAQLAGLGRERMQVPAMAESAPGAAILAKHNIPAGFDIAGFERGAKLNFIKLQAANDAGNLDELRELTTQEMFDELSREVRPGSHTDVVSLNADLLEVVTEADKHWASVRFSGAVREAPGAPAEDFQEVWNLVKPANGSSGWLLAGIQQMQ